MTADRLDFFLLNIGHFLCHLFMLIFAGVAALALTTEWQTTYSALLAFATPGFVAFGVFALPAGWLADRWSRRGMMTVYFLGGGLASMLTAASQTPLQLGVGLFVIGVFAAIYHPVGLALVTATGRRTGMRLAVNGVWGNLGVASAALITGILIDAHGWRAAFFLPGLFSIVCGVLYLGMSRGMRRRKATFAKASSAKPIATPIHPALIRRTSIIVFVTTAVSSIIFQSTTFALPKIFEERLQGISVWLLDLCVQVGVSVEDDTATMIGIFAFLVFALSSVAQLVVGKLLDQFGPRRIFLGAAAWQLAFYILMPGLHEGWALLVTFGFMLGAFGQIPINDFLIGKMADGPYRARVYGVRYVVSFTMLAATLPMISVVYKHGGFDALFQILAVAALVLLVAVWRLPREWSRGFEITPTSNNAEAPA